MPGLNQSAETLQIGRLKLSRWNNPGEGESARIAARIVS
jgi:hypothetical protein